jgi:hypothetical protein
MLKPITGPILDASGRPANGWVRVRASTPFDIAEGHVSKALSTVTVTAGVPTLGGEPWKIPVTPDGVYFTIVQDLDGDEVQRYDVVVPDAGASLTYSQLLSNRGGVGVGFNPFMWDLSGGIDFPAEALPGDWGIDYTSTPGTVKFFTKGAD